MVAVAEQIERLSLVNNLSPTLFYLGQSGYFSVILENAGIVVHNILGGKIRNYFSFKNFLDPFLLCLSFFQALFWLLLIMPDVVFSKGGPGALSVVLAARFYRIPVIIHDSDAVPGRTNKISAFFATRIAVSFSSAFKYFQGKNVALTGNPIRAEFFETNPSKQEAVRKLGFGGDVPLILILGASQGATRINDFIFDNIHSLIQDFQILHQVGVGNFDEAVSQREFILGNLSTEEKDKYKVVPYLEDDYKIALSAADVVVARSSGGVIFEVAAYGKPAILIPLPEAAQNHQRENAYEYASTGAAVVMEQENLLPNLFKDQLVRIIKNEATYAKMSEAAFAFAKPEAAKTIAEELLNISAKM